MSIFDDLSKDSFLSKRAANKQSGFFGRKADAEIADELGARNKADTEVASDLGARNEADTKISTDIPARKKTETAYDVAAKNRTDDSELSSKMTAKENGFSSDIVQSISESDSEVASDMLGTNQYGTQTYSHAGVAFNKLSEGEAKINYAGLLSKEGASEVIGIYGYGSNQNWENVSSIPLAKDYSGNFTASIPIVNGKNINFAFKDMAENWDNNSGLNYTFVN